jgi:hypothetical protein
MICSITIHSLLTSKLFHGANSMLAFCQEVNIQLFAKREDESEAYNKEYEMVRVILQLWLKKWQSCETFSRFFSFLSTLSLCAAAADGC